VRLTGIILRGARKVLRSTGQWLLNDAHRIDSYVRSIDRARALSPESRLILEKNRIFRNKHHEQRCFIIGNGTSLKTQDLSPLANELTFVMNAFWKHSIVEKWQPTYYFLCDPLFFDGSEPMKEFFRRLSTRIHNSTFFVPLSAAKAVQKQELLPQEQTYYVAFADALSSSKITDIDLSNFVPDVINVSQFCIMVAMYMGCSPIYLLGLDHDWLSHRGKDQHFYSSYVGLEKHPKFRPNLEDWSYKYNMECVLTLWRGYENLLEYANQKGTRILNATNGGFLDVFERINYKEVIDRATP